MNRLFMAAATILVGFSCSVCQAQEPKGVADRLLEDLQGEEKAKANRGAETPRSWHTLAAEMKRISEQLARPASSMDTLAAQAAIIDELTRLLEKSKGEAASLMGSTKSASEKKEGSGGERNSSGAKNDDNHGATGDGPATKAGSTGKTAGGGGSDAVGSSDILVRRAWGQLPGRVRERLQTGAPEKFHQKYQAETEGYFRRLSELEHRP